MASPQPRGSSTSASSISGEPAPSCADHLGVDPSSRAAKDGKRRRRHGGDDDDSRASKKQRIPRVASPVAHLSCARIRPFVHRPKQQTQVSAPASWCDAQAAITNQNTTVGGISCSKKIDPAVPASHPTAVVQPSGLKDKLKVPCAGVLRKDAVIKTKQEAGKRVQASATTTIPPLSHPASAMKVHSSGVVRNNGVVKMKQVAGKRVRSAGVVSKEAHVVIKTKQEASRSVQSTATKSIWILTPRRMRCAWPLPPLTKLGRGGSRTCTGSRGSRLGESWTRWFRLSSSTTPTSLSTTPSKP
jgi:hypothetical protein